MNSWLSLILSLPTQNATARMRVWRALKTAGAAVLRDGVYLLPDQPGCQITIAAIAEDVRANDGTAHVLRVADDGNSDFVGLFDRSDDYASLLHEIVTVQDALRDDNAMDALKQARKFAKILGALVSTDYFPGEACRQAEAALLELERRVARILSPDEPLPAAEAGIHLLDASHYQQQLWATRKRPWVDRLASGWLIRRHIDPQARFLWLDSPRDCPANALGFDFDGARFSHVEARVTFEVLLASFGLETPVLKRLGAIVHFLDAGGTQPPEALGVERVLAGMREGIADDDQLLLAASGVFEGLFIAFEKESSPS